MHPPSQTQGLATADNSSDLDPHDPVAFLDRLERMGRAASPSPPPEGEVVDTDARYAAEDKDSNIGMESLGVKIVDRNSTTDIERQGGHEMAELDFMCKEAEDWTADSRFPSDQDGTDLERAAIMPPESNVKCWSPSCTAWSLFHGDSSKDGDSSKMPKSKTSTQDWKYIQSSLEYFQQFSGLPYYPEAAKLFDHDPVDEGQFRNPFTTLRARHVLLRSDGGSISPRSTRREPEADETGADSGVSRAARIASSHAGNSYAEVSSVPPVENPLVKSLSEPGEVSSADETLKLHDEESHVAASGFLLDIDVEALIAGYASPTYMLEDHDALVDKFRGFTPKPGDIYEELSFDLTPHEPYRECYCHWCQVHFNRRGCDDDRIYPHDPNPRCHCPACQIFHLKLRTQRMEEQRKAQVESLQVAQERKHKTEESEAGLRRELKNLKDEEESRFADVMRFRVQQLRAAQEALEALEAEETTTGGCLGIFDWVQRQLLEPMSP